MWKLAWKAVADTSALPPGTAGPWWEQSFLFHTKRSVAEHLLAHSETIGTNPMAHYPVLLAEVRALHGAPGQGFYLCGGRSVVGQERKIDGKHLWNSHA